jgi:transcriptional regulator with XRE-family HTH domain
LLDVEIRVCQGRFAGKSVPQNRPVKINEYLDAVRAALCCRTDTELALRLRVLQSRISNYRTGRTLPNLDMARLIAAALNMRSGVVVGDMRRERALRRGSGLS